jgi:mono/diheme cytochrome c family protein
MIESVFRHRRWIEMTAVLLCFNPAAYSAGDKLDSNQGRIDYVLHCSGCHAQDGRGLEHKGIPALKDQAGYFLRTEGGRAYLMQIPGLLSAGMPDARAAGVTNYILTRFAGASLPENFIPYTAEEAKRYRETRPADIPGTRSRLAAELREAGFSIR